LHVMPLGMSCDTLGSAKQLLNASRRLGSSFSKTIAELVAQYEQKQRDFEKIDDNYPVVPTPKKDPNAVEFAFKCDQKLWAATNFSIHKFDMTDGGKLINDPIIHCEQDCICVKSHRKL
jgi:hypothetical protein